MSTVCCSYNGCYNSSKKIKNLKMFRFPRCPELCEKWIKNCGNTALTDLSSIRLYKIKRICQHHFDENEILPSGKLFKKAVPFPYTKPLDTEVKSSSLTLQPILAALPITLTRTEVPVRQYGKRCIATKTTACQTSTTFPHSDISKPVVWTEEISLIPRTPVATEPILPYFGEAKTIIKEEIEADEDNSACTDREDDQVEDSLSNEHCISDSSNFLVNTSHLDENTSRLGKFANTMLFQSLATILESDELLKLNIGNILTPDTCKFLNINSKQRRALTVRPSSNKEPTISEFYLKLQLLELKLRIHHLKSIIKNEEEISNLKKEVNQLQIVKEKMEIENNRDVYLQKMENLKLEHELLKTQLNRLQ